MTEASPQRDPHQDAARRAFLIVRLGALGDIVHALPLAAALRATWPDARIDWLVDVKHRAILDHVGGLSTIVPVDTRRLRRRRPASSPVVRRAARRALRRRDRRAGAAEVGGCWRTSPAPAASSGWPAGTCASRWRAGPTTRASSRPGRTSSTTRWRWRRRSARRPGPPRFALQPPASDIVARVRGTLGLAAGQPFALINPGAAWPNKRWPAERFGAVARHLRARHGWPSIVAWGPGEEDLARAVVAAADGAAAHRARDLARRAPGHPRRGRSRRLRGYRSAAPGRGAGHADRRDLRPDRSGPQRPVVAGRRHALAQPRLRVPPSAPVHRRGVVPGRARRGRGERRRGSPARDHARCTST